MAKGRGRFEAALGLIGVVALASTVILITGWNPLPGFADWLDRTGSLSEPAARWTERVGGQPSSGVVAGRAVIVSMRGTIEARDLDTGSVRWQREADWGAVAGDEAGAVAVVGRRGSGLEVLDPYGGDVRWKDGDAVGAWTYRDTVLTLSCGGLSDCTLASRAPADGSARWKTVLPGIGRVHAGVNSTLLGSRDVGDTYRDAVAASPDPVPPLLGFPLDQKVQIIDTGTGKRLREERPSSTSRIVVVDGRVIVSTAVPRDGNCRYTVEGRDAGSGRTVWKKDGYDLGTASGAGCEQRRDPAGGGGVLAATRGDNRAALLSARDGRDLWVGEPGESVVATDGRYAVVQAADRKTLRGHDLTTGARLWSHATPGKVDVALIRYAVLVSDPALGRLVALDPATGRVVVDVKTQGEVLGSGPDGLVLGRGRTIGFVRFH